MAWATLSPTAGGPSPFPGLHLRSVPIVLRGSPMNAEALLPLCVCIATAIAQTPEPHSPLGSASQLYGC
jgi:hypothetical protein